MRRSHNSLAQRHTASLGCEISSESKYKQRMDVRSCQILSSSCVGVVVAYEAVKIAARFRRAALVKYALAVVAQPLIGISC